MRSAVKHATDIYRGAATPRNSFEMWRPLKALMPDVRTKRALRKQRMKKLQTACPSLTEPRAAGSSAEALRSTQPASAPNEGAFPNMQQPPQAQPAPALTTTPDMAVPHSPWNSSSHHSGVAVRTTAELHSYMNAVTKCLLSHNNLPQHTSARMHQAQQARQHFCELLVHNATKVECQRDVAAGAGTAALIHSLCSLLPARTSLPGVLMGSSLGAGAQGVVRRVTFSTGQVQTNCSQPSVISHRCAPRVVHPYAHKVQRRSKHRPPNIARKFTVMTWSQIQTRMEILLKGQMLQQMRDEWERSSDGFLEAETNSLLDGRSWDEQEEARWDRIVYDNMKPDVIENAEYRDKMEEVDALKKTQMGLCSIKGLSMHLCHAVESAVQSRVNADSDLDMSSILWASTVHVVPVPNCHKALLKFSSKRQLRSMYPRARAGEPGVLIAVDMPCADANLRKQYLTEHAICSPDDTSVPEALRKSMVGLPFGARHVNVPAVCDQICQVCQGVDELCALDVLHGNLKPTNFLVFGKRTSKYAPYQPGHLAVKLGDLNAVTNMYEDTTMGTYEYMGPDLRERRARGDHQLFATDVLESTLLVCLQCALGCDMHTVQQWLRCMALWLYLQTPEEQAALLGIGCLQKQVDQTRQQACVYISLLDQVCKQGPAGAAFVALLSKIGYAYLQLNCNNDNWCSMHSPSFTLADLAKLLRDLQDKRVVPLQQSSVAQCMVLLPHSPDHLPVDPALVLPHLAQAAKDSTYMARLCAVHPDAATILRHRTSKNASEVGTRPPRQDANRSSVINVPRQHPAPECDNVAAQPGPQSGPPPQPQPQPQPHSQPQLQPQPHPEPQPQLQPDQQADRQHPNGQQAETYGLDAGSRCLPAVPCLAKLLEPSRSIATKLKRWCKRVFGCISKPGVIHGV